MSSQDAGTPERGPGFFLQPAALGVVFAVLATLVWSVNFIVGRGLVSEMPPVTLAFLRWVTAFCAVIPFALPALRREWRHFASHWRYYCITSIIGISFFNTAIYIAAHTVPAVNMSLIATTSPLFIIVLARILFGEPITFERLVGITVVLCGIVLLIARGDLSVLLALSFQKGDLIMLAAALSFSIYTLLVRKKPTGCGQLSYLAVTFGLGLLFLAPFSFLELMSGEVVHFTPRSIGGVLYAGVASSLFSFWCWGRAISLIGASRASIIYYSIPLFSGIEAVLLLGEPVMWVHYVSGALILGGLIFATREPVERRQKKG